jgi:hypothetical protein
MIVLLLLIKDRFLEADNFAVPFFSSPELKAQVSYSDRRLSV